MPTDVTVAPDPRFADIDQAPSEVEFRNIRDTHRQLGTAHRGRAHGLSSDALTLVGLGLAGTPAHTPYDHDDLDACERVYQLATDQMRARMAPHLAQFRTFVAERTERSRAAREQREAQREQERQRLAADNAGVLDGTVTVTIDRAAAAVLAHLAAPILDEIDDGGFAFAPLADGSSPQDHYDALQAAFAQLRAAAEAR